MTKHRPQHERPGLQRPSIDYRLIRPLSPKVLPFVDMYTGGTWCKFMEISGNGKGNCTHEGRCKNSSFMTLKHGDRSAHDPPSQPAPRTTPQSRQHRSSRAASNKTDVESNTSKLSISLTGVPSRFSANLGRDQPRAERRVLQVASCAVSC